MAGVDRMELFRLMGTIAVDATQAQEAIDDTSNRAENKSALKTMTTEEKKAIEIIVKGAIERLLLNIKCQRRRETFE